MTTWPGTSIPKSTRNAFDWRSSVRPMAFGSVGFFLPGLAGLESLTKRMEAAAARVNLRVAA